MVKSEIMMEQKEQEFTRLVEKHKTVIYTVCYMFSGSREEAEDLFQDVSDYEYLKAGMDKQTIINRQLMETVFRNRTCVLTSNRTTAMVSIGAAIIFTLAVSYIRDIDMRIAGMLAAFFALMLVGYGLIYHRLGNIVFICVAILAGICIQYFTDRKILRSCDDIIGQLKDRS